MLFMIPLSYNVRSLLVRKTTTVATALGIALVVFVLASSLMLAAGIKKTMVSSGSANSALVIRGKRIFAAAGAREAWGSNIGPMHIMGGTIMGDHAEQSVTNEYGQCHDVPNLVITGPGIFPTSGGVNPTFTLSALTLRSVEYLLKEWNTLINKMH